MSCPSDANDNRQKGNRGDISEIKPNWLKCPPTIRERVYPVPEGVEISPISEGGRNGGKKNKFKCGQCGEDKKPKEIKPNAPADCPMMRSRACVGAESPVEQKVSILDKVKNLFGIGKEDMDMRLVNACKQLGVEDEQIRHHRDVFNTQLFCRKDGYFSPFCTRVDCQGKPDDGCTCGEEEVLEEEEFEEDQECDEDDDYYEEDIDVVCAENETETVVEQENMLCTCQCITEPASGSGCAAEEASKKEEECVEDAEGECILEESAECMDPQCKFFLEDQDGKKKKKELFDDVYSPEEKGQQDCIAMNNFIIRVQAPFSESKTNETCEQIIARLTNRKPQYPEPGPRVEKKKTGTEEKCDEAIEITVKQISVEKPTCECEDPKLKGKNNGKSKEEIKKQVPSPSTSKSKDSSPAPPKDECNDSPSPPPPPTDECDDIPPSPPPIDDECEDIPPKEPECGCGCNSEANNNTYKPPLPNDCEILSEEELLKKPLKQINCGCPKPTCLGCKESPVGPAFTCKEASVWNPPPPPPCSRCGASERGKTEDCYLCNITRRMRSGCPEIPDKPPTFLEQVEKQIKESSDSCTPEYLPDGSLKYKGGMCMSLASSFIWHLSKRTPPGGFFDRFTGECGDEEKLKATTGTDTYSDAIKACNKNTDDRAPYRGGMSMEKCQSYLCGLTAEEEKLEAEKLEKQKEKCKAPPKEPPKPPPQCPPRPQKNKNKDTTDANHPSYFNVQTPISLDKMTTFTYWNNGKKNFLAFL